MSRKPRLNAAPSSRLGHAISSGFRSFGAKTLHDANFAIENLIGRDEDWEVVTGRLDDGEIKKSQVWKFKDDAGF